MENYFKTKVNYKSLNFYNEYVDKYDREIRDQLDSLEDKSKSTKIILNSIGIVCIQTNEALKKLDMRKENDVEAGFNLVFKTLLGEIENEFIQKEDIKQINNIIHLLSVQPHSKFKFQSLSELLYRIKHEDIIKKYDLVLMSELIKIMQIEIKSPFKPKSSEGSDDENENDPDRLLKSMYSEIQSVWRYCVMDFFDGFSKRDFIKYIEPIREYYE